MFGRGISDEEFTNILLKNPKSILEMMMNISHFSRLYPDEAPVINYLNIPRSPPQGVAIRDFGRLFAGTGVCRTMDLPSPNLVSRRISKTVPFMKKLSFNGYVIAGSYPVLMCQPASGNAHNEPDYTDLSHFPSDVDFYPFFTAPSNGDSPEVRIMPSYISFLSDIDSICSEGEYTDGDEKCKFESKKSVTIRREHCTTISFEAQNNYNMSQAILEYQIIHRAHTSPVSVIVGFDQPACKAYYDGEDIYFTLDAALCLYFGINPVDWRRESPSHAARYIKYLDYGYSPIFTGLDFSFGPHVLEYKKYFLPGCLLRFEERFDVENVSETRKPRIVRRNKAEFFYKELSCSLIYSKDEIEGNKVFNTSSIPSNYNPKSLPEESDYGMDSPQIIAFMYHSISMLIKCRIPLISVYANYPLDIIDETKYKFADIEMILKKVFGGTHAEFYYGTERIREISDRLVSFSAQRRDDVHGKVNILTPKKLAEFNDLQKEAYAILENRVKELEEISKEPLERLKSVKFITSNPGSQFTASFNAIKRETPEDYWGSMYVPMAPFKPHVAFITLMCIRKYGDTVLKLLDMNIIKRIYYWMGISYLETFFVSGSQILETPLDITALGRIAMPGLGLNLARKQLVLSRFPWHDEDLKAEPSIPGPVDIPRVTVYPTPQPTIPTVASPVFIPYNNNNNNNNNNNILRLDPHEGNVNVLDINILNSLAEVMKNTY